jgi:hypothetical protein
MAGTVSRRGIHPEATATKRDKAVRFLAERQMNLPV